LKRVNLFNILGSQKRTSKSKKNIRKNAWKQKVAKKATQALFLAKYVLSKGEISSTEKVENS
jgi:hypothetical protein